MATQAGTPVVERRVELRELGAAADDRIQGAGQGASLMSEVGPSREPARMPSDLTYERRWKTLFVLSLSLLIIGLDNTVLNVALPTLQTHFNASASTLQWIVDAYLLAFAGVLLTMGTLGDRFGRKRALQSGLVLFGIASVLAALAQSSEQLIVLRAAMGDRRRDDHARDAVGDHGRLPARGAREGDRDLVGDRGRRDRPRAVRRRPAARVAVVERGVLAQRADRRRSRSSPGSGSCRRAATRNRARSTSSAPACRSPRW